MIDSNGTTVLLVLAVVGILGTVSGWTYWYLDRGREAVNIQHWQNEYIRVERMWKSLPKQLRDRIDQTLGVVNDAAYRGNLRKNVWGMSYIDKTLTLEDVLPSWWLCEVLNTRDVDVAITARAQSNEQRTDVLPVRDVRAELYNDDGSFSDPDLEDSFQAWLNTDNGFGVRRKDSPILDLPTARQTWIARP